MTMMYILYKNRYRHTNAYDFLVDVTIDVRCFIVLFDDHEFLNTFLCLLQNFQLRVA